MRKALTSYQYLMRNYVDYIEKRNLDDSEDYDLMELLRYSICKGFKLQTIPSGRFAEQYGSDCSKYIMCKLKCDSYTEKEKQGILEACLHILNMTLQKRKEMIAEQLEVQRHG